MSNLSMRLFGSPQFMRDGASVTLGRAKGVALLVYLAVTRVAQPRERLLDLLWPESMPQAARKNMRNTLWAIGEALGDHVLEHDGTTMRLADTVAVDIQTLEDGLLLLSSGSVAALEAAANQYRGPLADGLTAHEAPDFEVWLTTERERLALVYLRLLERIIALRGAAGDWQSVIVHAQHALVADPLRESMHLALIEAHVRLGQRAQAAQQYAALTAILHRELDVDPLPETTARYEALLADASAVAKSPPYQPRQLQALSAPFVGRAAEFAALDEERALAAQGTARVVLISGDLGIGKSQLWRTWLATRAIDGIVLTTHALETGEPLPFGPLLAMFRQPGPAQALLEPSSPLAPIWLAELARLLPEITFAALDRPPLTLSPAEERTRLLQALTEAIRVLANPLLVLILDDLHWADPSTLDWLVYLLDHLQNTPLLVIGTFRPQDAPERLTAIAAGWGRAGRLRALPLPHLTATEAQDLLTALGTPDGAEQLVHQSGGNPYFLTELQRAPTDLPPCNLAALVHARVQAIVPPSALQVLQAAAVLGDRIDFGLLRATSGRSEEETLDALDALVATAVLVAREGTYRFVHPLVATVVRQDLTPARRTFLHRRAAQALERAAAPQTERVAGQLVEHYLAADEPIRAADYAEQAAAQALAVGSFVEAAAYARRAIDGRSTPRRHLLLGEALTMIGGPSVAHTELEIALQGFEQADDPAGATQALISLALMGIATSQPDVARHWLARAPIERIEATDLTLGVRTHLLAASIDRQSQAYTAAAAQLDRATQLVQGQKLPTLETQIAFERGNLLASHGDLLAAVGSFATSLRLAQAASNPLYAAMAQNNLAYHTLLAGNIADAHTYINAAAELAERYALSFLWQYVSSTTGEIALAEGALDAADAALAQAYDSAQTWNNRVHMANVRTNQARVALARGDRPRARILVAEAQTLFGDAVDPFVRDKIERVGAEL